MGKHKSQRGGYRPGAGRKPTYGEPMIRVQMVLPPRVVEILDEITGQKKTRSAVVLELMAKAHKPIRDALRK